ncbi:hypothetical protein LBMAG33_5130 [Candidatus Levyibacteriota bacterium]|nr:DUF5522 domain-containing protein [Candidatus Levybacteria bacterium]GDX62203.1 hypothetical protein LBMAG33_5130 [Candidatus Levybacteria bacterium]
MINKILKKDKDFYYDEKGNMVMTEDFHRLRGYCCNNGCRNCPYRKNNDK